MKPSEQLNNEVRAGFIRQGSTLAKFCREAGLDKTNASRLLRGKWDGMTAWKGAKAKEWLEKIVISAAVDITITWDDENGDLA